MNWFPKMTKKYEFDWLIPIPTELTAGATFDRWFENEKETKENDFEKDALFRVDEYGFFLYWKSDGRVSDSHYFFPSLPF